MISTGRTWRDIAARQGLSPNQLTAAQYRTLAFSPAKIAKRLECSPRTVTVHLTNARRRAGVRTDAELCVWLCRHGLHAFQAWPKYLLQRERLFVQEEAA